MLIGLPTRKGAPAAVFLTAAPHGDAKGAAAKARAAAVAAEGTELVHLLASSLRVGQSLASAVRFAAAHAGPAAAEELERVEWAVRLRHYASIDEGFLAFADAVGAADLELKRALVTLHGAEAEATREGLERRLDRAYDIVLKGEERKRQRLAGGLERPVQALFGLAVVLPLVLASLLPMMQLSGGSMGLAPTAALLLVVVPLGTLAGASRLLRRNFLGAPVSAVHQRWAIAAALLPPTAGAIALLSALAAGAAGSTAPIAAAIACAGTAAACGTWVARGAAPADATRAELEKELPDLLHAVGTRMAAGRPAEHALLEAVEASRASALAARLRGVLFDVIVGRRSLPDAIERDDEVRGAPRVFPALRLLASTADRDTEVAGRVVLHLSEFERLRAEAAGALRSRLKSLVDTTRTTSTLLAPLILGITAGMYGLLSTIGGALAPGASSGAGASTSFAAVVVLYLAIEVLLADWFAARLVSERAVSDFARAAARDVPVAMALFVAALIGSAALF